MELTRTTIAEFSPRALTQHAKPVIIIFTSADTTCSNMLLIIGIIKVISLFQLAAMQEVIQHCQVNIAIK